MFFVSHAAAALPENAEIYKDPKAPVPTTEILKELTARYIYVYEHVTGRKFVPADQTGGVLNRIETNVLTALKELT